MRFVALLCLAFSLWAQKKPEVELLDIKGRRIEEAKVAVDGRVRVTADKPIRKLTVIFDFLSTDNAPLTSLKAEVDDEVLNPGEESSFHAVAMNPPGAVKFKLRVVDGADKQLRASNTGPFVIE